MHTDDEDALTGMYIRTQEGRAERAEAEAVRANSVAFKLTRDLEKLRGLSGSQKHHQQGEDSDSAYGMAGGVYPASCAEVIGSGKLAVDCWSVCRSCVA